MGGPPYFDRPLVLLACYWGSLKSFCEDWIWSLNAIKLHVHVMCIVKVFIHVCFYVEITNLWTSKLYQLCYDLIFCCLPFAMHSWLYANPVLSMNQVMLQCLQCLLLHMLLQEQTVRPRQPVCWPLLWSASLQWLRKDDRWTGSLPTG